jgi:RecA-family ATPase
MNVKSFSQVRKMVADAPTKKFLWSGVKEKSFGLVFGPSKSGKTMFCENLAISIAVGKPSFFGYELDGNPKKVLFVGLEESDENRGERNVQQCESLSSSEQELMESNYFYQDDFPRAIHTDADWELLETIITESEAEVVFIDSITRLSQGKIEESAVAERIMLRLRSLAQDLDITLFAIHHTPKLYNSAITINSIKGSSVFAQESDFAIGVSRTDKKDRYMKNVFFRYTRDDDEFVKEFIISDAAWLEVRNTVDEDEILNRKDRRLAVDKKTVVCNFFNDNPTTTYTLEEAVAALKKQTGLQDRQIKTHLSDLVSSERLVSPQKGQYASVKNNQVNNSSTTQST